jgi:pimeloyl-ACP methyl ester carboxylesterase
MTALGDASIRESSVRSADGTSIGYRSVGAGPGLIVVGGVLSSAASYLPLARRLADRFEVHVIDRRGRAGSGPQRPGHSIEAECADLGAVMEATGGELVFGHSFGGLVALETARRRDGFERLFVYEPGVPLYGWFDLSWLDGYERRLERGDRRAAFAWMVKHGGFAPRALRVMPLWYVRALLSVAMRGQRWAKMEPLLEANLGEHRIQAALEAPSAERFASIKVPTELMGGARSPELISRALLTELAQAIPEATVRLLPGLGHLAPEDHPAEIAAAIVRSWRHSAAAVEGTTAGAALQPDALQPDRVDEKIHLDHPVALEGECHHRGDTVVE